MVSGDLSEIFGIPFGAETNVCRNLAVSKSEAVNARRGKPRSVNSELSVVRKVEVDHSRDALLTEFGKKTLTDRYLLPGESYQDMFARVSQAYATMRTTHNVFTTTCPNSGSCLRRRSVEWRRGSWIADLLFPE